MILLSINYTSYENLPSFNSRFYITESEYNKLSDWDKEIIKPITVKVADKYVYTISKINVNNGYFNEVILDIIQSLSHNKPVISTVDYKFEIKFISDGVEYVYSYEMINGDMIDEEIYYKVYKVDYEGNLINDSKLMFMKESSYEMLTVKDSNVNKFMIDRLYEDEIDSTIINKYQDKSSVVKEFNEMYSHLYETQNISSLSETLQTALIVNFSPLFNNFEFKHNGDEILPNTLKLKKQAHTNRIKTLFNIHYENINSFGVESYTNLIESILNQLGINYSLEFKVHDEDYDDLYILSPGLDSIQFSIHNTENIELLNTLTAIAFAVYHVMSGNITPTPLMLNCDNLNEVLIISLRTIYATNKLLNTYQIGNNESYHQLFLIDELSEDLNHIQLKVNSTTSLYNNENTYVPQYTMNELFDPMLLFQHLH